MIHWPKEGAEKMGSIRETKLKKGGTRFQAEIRLKGHPTLTTMFDRKTDAKAWIQKTEADIRCGRHQLYAEGKKHTFAEAVEKYKKEQPISVSKKGHLEWWKQELGVLYLQDIRPAIISEKKQKLLNEVNTKGKIRTKSTCNRFLSTLSHLMSICMKQWEWIFENAVRKISREKEPRERTRFLTQDERISFLEACKQSENPLLFPLVVLLNATGCRYTEIRSLRWTSVDLLEGKITIEKSKNGDARSLPVRGMPLEILRNLAAKSNSIGFIFPSKDRRKPMEFRRSLRTAIRRAGLKNMRPHDLRHDFATQALAQGLSLGEIGHLLGHRSPSVTRKYAHLTKSRSVDAIAKISDQIFDGVGGA